MREIIIILLLVAIVLTVAMFIATLAVLHSGITVQVNLPSAEPVAHPLDADKLRELFEKANETDITQDPEFKEVMAYLDNEFGGVDYGNEPSETEIE